MYYAILWGVILSAFAIFSAVKTAASPGDIANFFASPSGNPSALACDGKNLWLADSGADSIYEIDPSSGKTIAAIPTSSFHAAGMAWDGRYFWAVDDRAATIVQFDIQTRTIINSMPCPIAEPTGLAWDGTSLWLSSPNTISQVSPIYGAILRLFPAPAAHTSGLSFDGEYLWSADWSRHRIYMISPNTGEVIQIYDSPALNPWGLAFANGKLYNADNQTHTIYQLETLEQTYLSKSRPQKKNMNYVNEVRNDGPAALESLDIYLALPQNSDHQELEGQPVFDSEVPPKYLTDQWGQSYAAFTFKNIPVGASVKASYTVTAEMYENRYYIRPEKVGGLADIPQEIKDTYLADDTMFDIRNPVVLAAAKNAAGGETNPYWMARRIYRWIIDHMSYELDGGWSNAPIVVGRGTGSCSEYSFVFSAMCRAVGIPTRFTGAVVVRGQLVSEDRTFHRWCEIYLPHYGWVPVDPSGGDSASPETQARNFGCLDNNYLITTTGSESDVIGWGYNSGERWQASGTSKVFCDHVGIWTPADTSAIMTDAPSSAAASPGAR